MQPKNPPMYSLERLDKKRLRAIEDSGFLFQEAEKNAADKGRILLVLRTEGMRFPLLALQTPRKKETHIEPFAVLYTPEAKPGSPHVSPSWERLLLGRVPVEGLLPFARAAQNAGLEAMLSRQGFLWSFDCPAKSFKEFLLDGPPPRLISFASIYEGRPYFHLPQRLFLAICGTFPFLELTPEEIDAMPDFLIGGTGAVLRPQRLSYSKYNLMPPPPAGHFACYLVAQVEHSATFNAGGQPIHPCRWFRPILQGGNREGFFYVRMHNGTWTTIPIPPMPETFFADLPSDQDDLEATPSPPVVSSSLASSDVIDAEFTVLPSPSRKGPFV